MIVKAPTVKSRIAAGSSILCVLIIYVAEGWIEPPPPDYIQGFLAVASIGLLFVARSIREKEGPKVEIPEYLKNDVVKFGTIEASFSLLSGLSVVFSVLSVQFGASKILQRWMFCGSVAVFLLTGAVSYWALRNIKRILAQ